MIKFYFLDYNQEKGKLEADINATSDPMLRRNKENFEKHVKNIYRVLMSRGMKGCYVYFTNKDTEKYFKSRIDGQTFSVERQSLKELVTEYIEKTFKVPVLGMAPCGAPFYAEENTERYVEVDANKLKPGYKYFILRASGDSMNLAGINDGDLVLCRQQIKAYTGDKVVSLLGDNVTIKVYDKKDGRRILLPKSTNKTHMPIEPGEGDVVQGVVQEIL